jgi:hypothetical protein
MKTFVIRLNIKKFSYEIMDLRCDSKTVSEVISFIKNSNIGILNIIRTRYDEMKKAGTEIIKKFRSSENANEHKNVRTERNGACPCGSGKKYKKCCGRI